MEMRFFSLAIVLPPLDNLKHILSIDFSLENDELIGQRLLPIPSSHSETVSAVNHRARLSLMTLPQALRFRECKAAGRLF